MIQITKKNIYFCRLQNCGHVFLYCKVLCKRWKGLCIILIFSPHPSLPITHAAGLSFISFWGTCFWFILTSIRLTEALSFLWLLAQVSCRSSYYWLKHWLKSIIKKWAVPGCISSALFLPTWDNYKAQCETKSSVSLEMIGLIVFLIKYILFSVCHLLRPYWL